MQKIKREEEKIRVTEIQCRTALSPSRLPGFDYALNPYKGCVHGCLYCYAPNILRIPRGRWGSFIEIKRNIPKVLANELKNKEKGVVGISTTTDPYQPIENEFKLTRYCLEQLLRYDFPVSIITKSSLVTRDLDLLSQFSEVEVGMTITTDNDRERKLLEPKSSSIESRILALKECSEKGVATYAFLGPLFPTIDDNGLSELIKNLKDAGVSKIMADRLNLKPGIWNSIYDAINNDTAYAGIWKTSVFGETKGYDHLFSALKNICHENALEFKMQTY